MTWQWVAILPLCGALDGGNPSCWSGKAKIAWKLMDFKAAKNDREVPKIGPSSAGDFTFANCCGDPAAGRPADSSCCVVI
jgi:hypothetical protein